MQLNESNVFCTIAVREQLKELTKQYDKSENDLKALQSVGQVQKLKIIIMITRTSAIDTMIESESEIGRLLLC